MKRILIVGILLFSSLAMAGKFTRGEGSFRATDEDSFKFIGQQLSYEGFKSVISKELDKAGLNKELFWKKYDEKLLARYDDIKKNLQEQMKITDASTKKEKEAFKKRLRYKQLTFRRNFGKIDNIIRKHVIKKQSRSQKNPNYRYIRLEAEVNKKKLMKLYYSFVRGQRQSEYGTLFVSSNFVLRGINYSEMGIENENDFGGVITKNWQDELIKNKPSNIANIEILSKDQESKLMEYIKMPAEVMVTNTPELFVNSLLLEVEMVIDKKRFYKKINEYGFAYSGSAYLKDLQTNQIIKTYKFSPNEKNYTIEDEVNLANIIANHVYRMATGTLAKITSAIKKNAPISTVQRVSLTDFKNIKEVYALVKELEDRGLKYSVKARIESFAKGRAEVIMYYDGQTKDMKQLLYTIKAAKNDLEFDLIDSNNILGIKFNKESAQQNI